MELNEYQNKAMTTCTPSCKNISYMLLNLVGEVGELSSKIAKSIRKDECEIDNNSIFYFIDIDDYREEMRHLKLEAGDILWQLAGLTKSMGWTLEEVAAANLEKLASRANRGKIIGDGDDR